MSITRRPGVCIGVLAICAVLIVVPAAAQPVPLFPAQLNGAKIHAPFGQDNSPEAVETDIPLPGIKMARRSCSPALSGPRPAAAPRAGSPMSIASI